jgi:hypothetical protein
MFSPDETKVLKILRNRKMTIAALADFFYDGKHTLIERNYLGGVVRRINLKCEVNRLPWTLKGEGGGRKGRVIWKGKRR